MMNRRKIEVHFIRNEKYYLWSLLLLFFILRMVYVFHYGNFDKSTFQDAITYNEYAKEIIHGTRWLISNEFIGSYREPFYPIFVAGVYAVFGKESFAAVYIMQALINCLTLILIFKLACYIFKKRSIAYLSMIWAGLYIYYFRFIGEVLRETIISFLLTLLILLLIRLRANCQVNWKYNILPALVYTALIHTDGRYLFYAPFLIVMYIVSQGKLLVAVQNYFIFGLMVVFLCIPWAVRNYTVYGDLIIVSSFTLNLTGDRPVSRSELFDTSIIDHAYETLHFCNYNNNYPTEFERNSIRLGKNPKNRSPQELKAIKSGKRAPRSFLGRKWYFMKKMWLPADFGGYYAPFPMAYFEEGYSREHNIISIVQYGTLLPFCLVAILSIVRQRLKIALMLLLPLFVHVLLHIITFGLERYRLPVDSFIIILGMYGVYTAGTITFYRYLRCRKRNLRCG